MNNEIDYKAKYEQLTARLAEAEFQKTFYKAGGKKPSGYQTPDEPKPIDFVRKYFGDRIRYEDGDIQVLDQLGQVETIDDRPKTLEEKLNELRPSLPMFFDESMRTSTVPGVYTTQDARFGRASIDEIAAGIAEII